MTHDSGKQRITVQVLNMIDGEIREVVAMVKADSEQDAVDCLFKLAKDEKAYKYLGHDGILKPTNGQVYTFPRYAGEWYAKG